MKQETLQEISDLISILIIDVPFCMPILNLNIKECDDRLAKADGKNLYINEEQWETYAKSEKLAILFHEWMHISLFHSYLCIQYIVELLHLHYPKYAILHFL